MRGASTGARLGLRFSLGRWLTTARMSSSGRWESNPLRSAWEADILPVNYARITSGEIIPGLVGEFHLFGEGLEQHEHAREFSIEPLSQLFIVGVGGQIPQFDHAHP